MDILENKKLLSIFSFSLILITSSLSAKTATHNQTIIETTENISHINIENNDNTKTPYQDFIDYLTQKNINFSINNNEIVINQNFYLRDYTGQLPSNLSVKGDLTCNNKTSLTTLPSNLSINGTFDIMFCGFITDLPNQLTVGFLDLNNSFITSVPDDLSVDNLNLSESFITHLPDNFTVKNDLDFERSLVKKLPNNLKVGGKLILNNTLITELPEDLSVGRSLHLDVNNIKNIVYREHVGEEDISLFSVYINGEIQVSVPHWSFLGNLQSFESKLNERFSTSSNEEYLNAARECVEELSEKRKNRSETYNIDLINNNENKTNVDTVNPITLDNDNLQEKNRELFTLLNKQKYNYFVKHDTIFIDHNLELNETSLLQLPDNLYIKGFLDINSSKMTQLPKNLHVSLNLDASNTLLTELPDNLYVHNELDVSNTPLKKLPNNLSVKDLRLNNTLITNLPDNLVVNNLNLMNTPITHLPKTLSVKQDLILNYSQIKTLPDNLTLKGDLDLSNTSISQLPNKLSVGQSLKLNNTQITFLPNDLFVGKSLLVDVKNIKNITYRENIGNDDVTLFAVFVNNEIQISVPRWSFLGNIKLFEEKTIEKLSNEEVHEYQQAAKECFIELINIRENSNNDQIL